jgi:hypothetical protein
VREDTFDRGRLMPPPDQKAPDTEDAVVETCPKLNGAAHTPEQQSSVMRRRIHKFGYNESVPDASQSWWPKESNVYKRKRNWAA